MTESRARSRLRLHIIFLVLVLCLSAVNAWAESHLVRVLHVNDFHGYAEPYKPLGSEELLGGIAFLAGEADRYREGAPTLFLAAGDMIAGNNWANLFKGKSVIEIMNAMGFDGMVLGNHEFDYGTDVLKKRISEAKFPVLGANVSGMSEILRPYFIKEVGGIKIGVIGVVTPDTPVTTNPRNVEGLHFAAAAETVRKYMELLKNKTDLVIVLSHLGYVNDIRLAEEVKGIGIIIGGHSHTKLMKPDRVGDTLVVQAWEHAKALGVLDITVEDGKITKLEGRLEEIRPGSDRPNRRIAGIVERYETLVSVATSEKIGVAGLDLDGENVRSRETNFGDLVADIVRQRAGADGAIINGGSIRQGIHEGSITLGDIYSALPFDNYIVAIRLTGAQLRDALEYGVSGVKEREGRFPQVSGISFSYSISARPGSRIRDIFINGKRLELSKEYVIATNDFIAAGGDGYRAFGDAVKSSKDFSVQGGAMKGEKLAFSDAGTPLRDAVLGYIREKGTISPRTERRIKELP